MERVGKGAPSVMGRRGLCFERFRDEERRWRETEGEASRGRGGLFCCWRPGG